MRALLWYLSGFDHTRSHVEVGLLLVLVGDEGNHVDVVARVRTSHSIDALIGPTEPVEKGSESAQMLISTMARGEGAANSGPVVMCDDVYFCQASDLDFMISMGVICPSTSAERGIMAAMPTS